MRFLIVFVLNSLLLETPAVYCRVVENAKRLIKTSASAPPQWMHLNEVFELIRKDETFIDVTDFDYSNSTFLPTNDKEYPTTINFNSTVTQVISTFNWTRVWKDLLELDTTRYFAHDKKSLHYLLPEIQHTLTLGTFWGNGSVTVVDHALEGFNQRSIVVKLLGSDPLLKDEVVILGAHLDTISRKGPRGHAPGVDDNASGTSVILETLRAIVESEVHLNRSVEFHWYAAGEVGLRGSQALAQEYRKRNLTVVAMLNFDAVGYYVNGANFIGIFKDDASDELVQFLKLLTDNYLEFSWLERNCGFAGSDHASWTFNEYQAVTVGNVVSNPDMHTNDDDEVDQLQLNEYFKLAVAFAIELGGIEIESESSE